MESEASQIVKAPVRCGINGFGRIGRVFLRLMQKSQTDRLTVVHVNDPGMDVHMAAYLLKHDTVYGPYDGMVEVVDGLCGTEALHIKSNLPKPGIDVTITWTSLKSAADIPWAASGVEYVVECSGVNLTTATAQQHLSKTGAQKVILSAPPKDSTIPVFVLGCNSNLYVPGSPILSNASCTTNCVGPIAKVLHDNFGIESALMTTVHAVTASQRVVDVAGKKEKDPRSGRCALDNIIPASTGAAKMCGLVVPGLEGKITGMALRVPVSDVSVVDLTVNLSKNTSLKEVLAAIEKESGKGGVFDSMIMVDHEHTVSTDWRGSLMSAVVDATSCAQLGERFFKIIAFYDNEIGYAARLVDMICFVHATDFKTHRALTKCQQEQEQLLKQG